MKVNITESELIKLFSEVLTEQDNGICSDLISESSSDNDIKQKVKSEINKFLDINRNEKLEKRVKDIVLDSIKKDEKLQKEIVSICRNVLVQLYKNLWTRRSFWSDNLNNKTS